MDTGGEKPVKYEDRHQGSLRALVKRGTNQSVAIAACKDYYPYGQLMPDRNYQTTDYRYGYQGQYAETDPETGFAHFEAREFDSRLGRWMIPDPARQYWSPYMGMGNNPVSGVDPDGREELPNNFIGPPALDDWFQADRVANNDWFKFASNNFFNSYNAAVPWVESDWFIPSLNTFFTNNPGRPDANHRVTIQEGIAWAKSHPNVLTDGSSSGVLYLDARRLDFGRLSISDFNAIGVEQNVNLLWINNANSESLNTTYALGNTKMTLISKMFGGVVKVSNGHFNDYDWDVHGSLLRKTLIYGERIRAGLNDSHGFPIIIYGTGLLNK